jgi:F-type H+-transporting ATPase subunit c
MIFAAYLNGVARQPESAPLLRPFTIIGFAAAEALAIFGLVLFFIAG